MITVSVLQKGLHTAPLEGVHTTHLEGLQGATLEVLDTKPLKGCTKHP